MRRKKQPQHRNRPKVTLGEKSDGWYYSLEGRPQEQWPFPTKTDAHRAVATDQYWLAQVRKAGYEAREREENS